MRHLEHLSSFTSDTQSDSLLTEGPVLCLMKKGGCDCGAGCTLSEEVLNSRVKDVLRVKARLGLIHNPAATIVPEAAPVRHRTDMCFAVQVRLCM